MKWKPEQRIPTPPDGWPGPVISLPGDYNPDLPEWIPPDIDDISRLTAGATTAQPREYQFLSADDAIIPEAFGECVIKPRFASVVPSGANIILRCIWCRGEQGSMTLYAGNKLFTGSVTHYLGAASQTVNSTLATLVSGYADNLNGICYSVITLPGSALDLANSFSIVVKDRQIPDPRTTPTNRSDNPALSYYYVADILGLDVDLDSIRDAADYCDENIPTLTQKRWSWGMVFDKPVEIERQLKLIAEYAGCYHVRDGGTVKLVPDRATATTSTFSDAKADLDSGSAMIVANSLKLTKKRLSALPNQSLCQYTNTSKFPWRKPYAKTVVPVGDIRPTTFNMHGFRDFNTAKRYAEEKQNKFNLTDLKVSLESFDDALVVEAGDVVEVTHNVGLSSEAIRVLSTKAGREPGRWIINGEKYDPAVNSNATDSEPVYNDITLPDPSDVPNGPTPTVIDKNYTDEMAFTYSVLSISFTGVSWMFASGYRVKVYFGSFLVLETNIRHLGAVTHTVSTGAVSQGVLYTIEVWVINNYGNESPAPGTATKIADGKALGPSNIPDGTMTAEEQGFLIDLNWGAATDSDLKGYKVKRLSKSLYEAAANDDARWNHASAVLISERITETTALLSNQPLGNYYYGVKAIDNVYPKPGHESVLARWAEVTVTNYDPASTTIFVGSIYLRKATAPATPSVDDGAYNFSTLLLTPPYNGGNGSGNGSSADNWSATPLAGPEPQYISQATFDADDGGIDETCEWISPVILVQDGEDGASAITWEMSNQSPGISADSSGAVTDLSNTGTTLTIKEGETALTFTTSAVTAGEFQILNRTTRAPTGITLGAISGNGTNTATAAPLSAWTNTTDAAGYIEWAIRYMRAAGGSAVDFIIRRSFTIISDGSGATQDVDLQGGFVQHLQVAATATAGWSYTSGGIERSLRGVTYTTVNTWLNSGSAGDYELLGTLISGVEPTSGNSLDVWHPLSSAVFFTLARTTNGTSTSQISTKIRHATTKVVYDTSTVSLTAIREAA